MKALLYKEFKLAMHPICYLFVFLFPFMMLIPSFPMGVGFIYLLSCYPVLFLGANKGQQSNDLLYSTLLPVRKKDIVLARIATVTVMQIMYIAVMCALLPVATMIQNLMKESNPDYSATGFGVDSFASLIAFGILGFAIADLIFFPIYYKNGKSIVMSTLLTIIGFIVYLGIFTIGLPLASSRVESLGWYNQIFAGELWIQFIVLAVAISLSVLAHFLVYKISSKRLENVDF